MPRHSKSVHAPIEGFIAFSKLPKPFTDVLLIIVDTARTMPFNDKLDLADKVVSEYLSWSHPQKFLSRKP